MVIVPRAVYDPMMAHLRSWYPGEGCGVLSGNGIDPRASRHFPAHNAAEDPTDFSIIAPQEQLQIWNAIDDADEVVLSYYHSHPQSRAYPSARDIRYAQGWPGAYYIIVSFVDLDHPEVHAYLIHGNEVVEEPLIVED